jgi:hypothetical protein
MKQDVSIRDVYDLIQDVRDEMTGNFVQKNEFLPVKNIVYGMVGLILTSVAVAVVAQVVKAVGLQ